MSNSFIHQELMVELELYDAVNFLFSVVIGYYSIAICFLFCEWLMLPAILLKFLRLDKDLSLFELWRFLSNSFAPFRFETSF